MATLLFSVGVPMISGGDELCRTQAGNNNAYCQDNEVSWTDWTMTPERQDFLDFTRRLIAHLAGTTRCCAAGSSSRAGASAAPT